MTNNGNEQLWEGHLWVTPVYFNWSDHKRALDPYEEGWHPVSLNLPSMDENPSEFFEFMKILEDVGFDPEDWVEEWEELQKKLESSDTPDFDWENLIEGYEDDLITLEERVGDFLMDDFEIQESLEPIYNYFYEFTPKNRQKPEDVQKALWDLPVTLVQMNGGYVLALTGCGSDMTWEIVEAYMTLGFLPPVHFCRLPRIAGRGESERDKQIIAACREALLTAEMNLHYRKEYLNEHFSN